MQTTQKTPDHVINPTYPCSCTIAINGKALAIVYCDKHKAAPELLAALHAAEDYLLSFYGEKEWDGVTERPFALHNQIVQAISQAEGRAE